MVTCNKCGATVVEDALFCSNCGNRIELQKTKAPNSKKQILIISIIAVVVVALVLLIRNNMGTQKSSILPYGIEWGDSFETVKSKDADVKELTWTKDNKFQKSNCTKTGSYWNLSDEEIKNRLIYKFGTNNSLNEISMMVTSENNKISDEEMFEKLVTYYNDATKIEASIERRGYIENIGYFETIATWDTDEGHIDIKYFGDSGTFITIEP